MKGKRSIAISFNETIIWFKSETLAFLNDIENINDLNLGSHTH